MPSYLFDFAAMSLSFKKTLNVHNRRPKPLYNLLPYCDGVLRVFLHTHKFNGIYAQCFLFFNVYYGFLDIGTTFSGFT